MENKTKLKSCKMYEEEGKYYLDLKYTIEKIDGIYEKHIPKVALGIPTDTVILEKLYSQSPYMHILPEVECRFHLNNKSMFRIISKKSFRSSSIHR